MKFFSTDFLLFKTAIFSLLIPGLLYAQQDTVSLSFGPCGGKDSAVYYLKNSLPHPVNVYVVNDHIPTDTLRVLNFHLGITGVYSIGDSRVMTVLDRVAPLRNQVDLSSGSFRFLTYLPPLFEDRDLIIFTIDQPTIQTGDSLLEHLAELRDFVVRGGTVIFTGGLKSNHVIESTSLLYSGDPQNSITSLQPVNIPFQDEPMFASVNAATLVSQDQTYSFEDAGAGWIPLATCAGSTVVGYKQIGIGRVVYLGFNYYHTDQKIEQILENAISSSSSSLVRCSYAMQQIPANDSLPVYFYSNTQNTEKSGDYFNRFSIISGDSGFQTETVITHVFIDPRPCPIFSVIAGPCQRACISNYSTHSPNTISVDFGDGSVMNHPGCYDYSQIGTYSVSFTACNAHGCTTALDTITILAIGPVSPNNYIWSWSTGVSILTEVSLGSIQNQSSSLKWQDFACNFQTQLIVGKYYPVYFHTLPNYGNNVSLFLDVNQDGEFNHDELVNTHRAIEHNWDTIAIRKFPSALYNVPLRLRIVSHYTQLIPFYSAATTSNLFMEVEDYTVFLSPNTGIPPEARYTCTHSCDGFDAQFIFTGCGAPDSIRWEFSDGFSATGWQVFHNFPSPDGQWVILKVYNAWGNDSRMDTLHNPARPEFYYTTPVVAGVPVTMSTPIYPYVNWWWWTFPEVPALVQDSFATHIFATPGDFLFTFSMSWNFIQLFSGSYSPCQVYVRDTIHDVILGVPLIEDDANWKIFPNPFISDFQVSLYSSFTDEAKLTITDEHGKTIHCEKSMLYNGSNDIKLQIEVQGIYMLNIKTKSGVNRNFKLISISQ